VGGTVDQGANIVLLYRGNLEPIVVPLSWFRAPPGGPRPDPHDLAAGDHGHSVRLGAYEASAHTILYDLDREYRRQAKARRLRQDRTFGGALRRLRILRGLAQQDFEPQLSAREIARLEKGEINRPHAATLKLLAKRLGVRPDQLGTY
jgi:hypothetical protein